MSMKKSASRAAKVARRAKKRARRRKQGLCKACNEHPAIGWQLSNQGAPRHVCGYCAAPGQPILRRKPRFLQSLPGFMI